MASRTLILSGFGTNCEKETVYSCRRAGADSVEVVHINALYGEGVRLEDYHFLIFIGGFMDGDDLGGAKACANRFRYRTLPGGGTVLEKLREIVDQGRLMLGICNGFQLLVKLNLLPGREVGESGGHISIAPNRNGRFEDRWVSLAADPASPCIFTRGLKLIDLPVRHGEGRLCGETPQLLERLVEKRLAPLRYVAADGTPTESYPANPNGSPLGVAALCNAQGTVMGLMPHPEAFNHYTNHPRWQRRPFENEDGEGIALLRNAYSRPGS